MKISTLLRKAANEHLWVGGKYYNQQGEVFSCSAVIAAARDTYPNFCWWPLKENENLYKRKALQEKALAFLYELGCPVCSTTAFNEFKIGKTRQAVRYAWLMFAAQVAKEEGL